MFFVVVLILFEVVIWIVIWLDCLLLGVVLVNEVCFILLMVIVMLFLFVLVVEVVIV